jgi:hypothetical protein
MRHAGRFLLVMTAAACASGGSAPTPDPERRPVILTSETGVIEGERPRSAELALTASPVVAWTVAKRVYEKIGIPVTVENPASHQLGNSNFYKTRTLSDWRMGDLVDCGSGMTGRKADSYRIYMSLLTAVDPDGKGGTRLRTTLVAFGQDVAGGSTDRITCGSTGVLETAMNQSIRDNLPK